MSGYRWPVPVLVGKMPSHLSPWPGIFSLWWCCSSCVWGWCLLSPLSISLSAWIHFHRNLRFPQSSSSSSSRRSWICLYNSVSLWISDAGLVPIIFSTVLRLVTLTEVFWRTRTHPSLALPSLFHTFSFNVSVYYNCCLLFPLLHLIAWLPCIPTPTRLLSALIFILSFHFPSCLLACHTLPLFLPFRLSFLTWFPLSHLHQQTEMGFTQKQWGWGRGVPFLHNIHTFKWWGCEMVQWYNNEVDNAPHMLHKLNVTRLSIFMQVPSDSFLAIYILKLCGAPPNLLSQWLQFKKGLIRLLQLQNIRNKTIFLCWQCSETGLDVLSMHSDLHLLQQVCIAGVLCYIVTDAPVQRREQHRHKVRWVWRSPWMRKHGGGGFCA